MKSYDPLRQKAQPEMTASDVVEVVQLLTRHSVEVWVDGGWAVDSLLGEQTRRHKDLDIAIDHANVPKVRALLEAQGYKDVLRDDTRDCNFVLGDDAGHEVDIHSFVFDALGNNIYGCAYPAESLTGTGTIQGYTVQCIAPEWLVRFHTGYTLDAEDYQDVLALCNRFGIELPPEYDCFKSNGDS